MNIRLPKSTVAEINSLLTVPTNAEKSENDLRQLCFHGKTYGDKTVGTVRIIKGPGNTIIRRIDSCCTDIEDESYFPLKIHTWYFINGTTREQDKYITTDETSGSAKPPDKFELRPFKHNGIRQTEFSEILKKIHLRRIASKENASIAYFYLEPFSGRIVGFDENGHHAETHKRIPDIHPGIIPDDPLLWFMLSRECPADKMYIDSKRHNDSSIVTLQVGEWTWQSVLNIHSTTSEKIRFDLGMDL